MTTEATEKYLLVMYGPDRRVDEYDTVLEADAAYKAVTEDLERHVATTYAVRSSQDPRWRTAPDAGRPLNDVRRKAYWAARAARRKELGATARNFVKQAEHGERLSEVERKTLTSMRERGFTVEPFEVEDAVKSRVLVGREYLGGYYRNRGAGWWLPKSEGPLYKARTPEGRELCQTTLRYRGGFRRI